MPDIEKYCRAADLNFDGTWQKGDHMRISLNTDTLKGVEFRGKKVNGEIDEIHVFLDFKKKCGKWFLIYYESTDL